MFSLFFLLSPSFMPLRGPSWILLNFDCLLSSRLATKLAYQLTQEQSRLSAVHPDRLAIV